MKVNWRIKDDCDTYDIALKRYSRFLENQGRRPNTIKSYAKHIKEYIKFCQTPEPSKEKLEEFRDHLFDKHLSKSTINNFSFAIMQYHRMIGEPVKLPILKRNDTLPDFFTEDEVLAIFGAIRNIKHLAMIQTAFYGCLRSSELCNLDDGDLDINSLRIHVREGKGGRDGITYLNEACARTLRRYLEVRPPLLMDGRPALFYTDHGNRFDTIEVYRLVTGYKALAGITKRGGPHSLFRHSTATLMIAKGCDIRIVKEVLRHKDIHTTLRYAHVADKTKRSSYEQYLTL